MRIFQDIARRVSEYYIYMGLVHMNSFHNINIKLPLSLE